MNPRLIAGGVRDLGQGGMDYRYRLRRGHRGSCSAKGATFFGLFAEGRAEGKDGKSK